MADEREVQVAGAGPIRVEGGLIFPSKARHRAAAQHHPRVLGNNAANLLDERVQLCGIVVKRQADDRITFLRFCELSLFAGRRLVRHSLTGSKAFASFASLL